MSLADIHLQNGIAAHGRGDSHETERCYKAALRAKPDMLMARVNLSAFAGGLTQSETPLSDATRDRALSCWQHALLIEETPTERADSFVNLGGRAYAEFLLKIGHTDEALGYVHSACGPSRNGLDNASFLQQLLFRYGRYEELFSANDDAFEHAVASHPVEDDYSMVLLELFLGRYDEVERSRDLFHRMTDLCIRDEAFEIQQHLRSKTFSFLDGADLASLDSATAQGRAVLAPAIARRRSPLVAAMMVRDEIDILADSIACHLNQGVDLVLVTDNGSVDGSRDVLADLERSAPVMVLDEPEQTHQQALWMSRMVHLARDQHGADWVIAADADEIWLADNHDLPAAIARDAAFYGADTRLLLCQQATMFPRRDHTQAPDYRATDETMALKRPLKILPSTHPVDRQYYTFLHKCIVRTDGFLTLWHGNHYGCGIGPMRSGYATDITVLHYPLRSLEQLRRKHVRSRSAMEKNDTYDLVRDQYRPELVATLFETGTYPTPLLEALRAAGRLTDVDGIAALRDRSLPSVPEDRLDVDAMRRAAMAYFTEIAPHLPRAGRVR